LRMLRVIVPASNSASYWSANHESGGELTPRTVAVLGELVDHLFIGRPDKIRELDLGNGNHSVHGHPDCSADDPVFCKCGIYHSISAKLIVEPRRHTKYPAHLSYIFTQQHDPGVACHRHAKRIVDGLNHIHLRHDGKRSKSK